MPPKSAPKRSSSSRPGRGGWAKMEAELLQRPRTRLRVQEEKKLAAKMPKSKGRGKRGARAGASTREEGVEVEDGVCKEIDIDVDVEEAAMADVNLKVRPDDNGCSLGVPGGCGTELSVLGVDIAQLVTAWVWLLHPPVQEPTAGHTHADPSASAPPHPSIAQLTKYDLARFTAHALVVASDDEAEALLQALEPVMPEGSEEFTLVLCVMEMERKKMEEEMERKEAECARVEKENRRLEGEVRSLKGLVGTGREVRRPRGRAKGKGKGAIRGRSSVLRAKRMENAPRAGAAADTDIDGKRGGKAGTREGQQGTEVDEEIGVDMDGEEAAAGVKVESDNNNGSLSVPSGCGTGLSILGVDIPQLAAAWACLLYCPLHGPAREPAATAAGHASADPSASASRPGDAPLTKYDLARFTMHAFARASDDEANALLRALEPVVPEGSEEFVLVLGAMGMGRARAEEAKKAEAKKAEAKKELRRLQEEVRRSDGMVGAEREVCRPRGRAKGKGKGKGKGMARGRRSMWRAKRVEEETQAEVETESEAESEVGQAVAGEGTLRIPLRLKADAPPGKVITEITVSWLVSTWAIFRQNRASTAQDADATSGVPGERGASSSPSSSSASNSNVNAKAHTGAGPHPTEPTRADTSTQPPSQLYTHWTLRDLVRTTADALTQMSDVETEAFVRGVTGDELVLVVREMNANHERWERRRKRQEEEEEVREEIMQMVKEVLAEAGMGGRRLTG